jgi:hypothetical protein
MIVMTRYILIDDGGATDIFLPILLPLNAEFRYGNYLYKVSVYNFEYEQGDTYTFQSLSCDRLGYL